MPGIKTRQGFYFSFFPLERETFLFRTYSEGGFPFVLPSLLTAPLAFAKGDKEQAIAALLIGGEVRCHPSSVPCSGCRALPAR